MTGQTCNDYSDVHRLLVVLPTWVGDFVMATPTLRALRDRFSQATITGFGSGQLKPMVMTGYWFDDWIDSPPKRKGRKIEWFRAIKSLRDHRFDAAVLLPNSFRSALTAFLGGAKRRIGYDRDGRGWLLTHKLAPRLTEDGEFVPHPMVDYYGRIAAEVGAATPGDNLELGLVSEDVESVEKRLASAGLNEADPLVLICPGASFGPAKCWPAERFGALADRLVERIGASIVITCGPGEEEVAREVASAMRHPHELWDDPIGTLGEFQALVSRSHLVINNDTGPRHFAKAFDVPVITLFGPTHQGWTDTGYERERKIFVPVDCGPCQLKVCPLDHRCMLRLDVEDVARVAVDLVHSVTPALQPTESP
jgi:heptosyltransferase-2